MHILIVILHRPEKPTGVCRYAANLAKCLAETNEVTKITLVTGAWQRHYFETAFLLKSEKIQILGIDIRNGSLSRNLWFCFSLPKLVQSLQSDIVHLAYPLPFFRKLFPCPVVSTVHDLYPYQFPENFGYKQVLFNRLFFWKCINGSDAITCVSRTTLKDLEIYFPNIKIKQKKLTVIYNYVDFSSSKPEVPSFFKDQIEGPFILCVGQHRKNKNLDFLIRAYATLKEQKKIIEKTKLIIVGSLGPESEKLKSLIQQLSLEELVLFPSSISDDELSWLYESCTLFVIPSSFEGFCIPLVEALYFSCKVVCSNIPIFKEIGSENCIYFDLAGETLKNLEASIVEALKMDKTLKAEGLDRFTKSEAALRITQFYSGLKYK